MPSASRTPLRVPSAATSRRACSAAFARRRRRSRTRRGRRRRHRRGRRSASADSGVSRGSSASRASSASPKSRATTTWPNALAAVLGRIQHGAAEVAAAADVDARDRAGRRAQFLHHAQRGQRVDRGFGEAEVALVEHRRQRAGAARPRPGRRRGRCGPARSPGWRRPGRRRRSARRGPRWRRLRPRRSRRWTGRSWALRYANGPRRPPPSSHNATAMNRPTASLLRSRPAGPRRPDPGRRADAPGAASAELLAGRGDRAVRRRLLRIALAGACWCRWWRCSLSDLALA